MILKDLASKVNPSVRRNHAVREGMRLGAYATQIPGST
jgi:hypothetical protein